MTPHLDERTINLFLDEQLDPPARQRATAHLANCARCRAELGRWSQLFVGLDALAPQAATEDAAFIQAVLAQTDLSPPAWRRLWPWLAVQGGVVVSLLSWLWPRLTDWADHAWEWLGGGAADWAAWLSGLWGAIVAWAGWLGQGMTRLVSELNLTWPSGPPLWQGGLLLGAVLLVWLMGNRLLLRDGTWQGS